MPSRRGKKRSACDDGVARDRCKAYKAAYYRSMREAVRVFDAYVGITVAGKQIVTGEDSDRPVNGCDARDCISAKELKGIESARSLTVITDETKLKMFQHIKPCFSLQSWERKICAVCDCSWPARDVKRCELRPRAVKRWALKLRCSTNVPIEHKHLYDVSRWFPGLKGALLSQRGVERSETGDHSGLLLVCHSCFTSLSSSSQKPPKFAIANGFDIGHLPPSLQDASMVEKQLTSMTSLASSITLMQGGRHKCLKGHVTVLTLDPSEISVRLPQLLRDGTESFLVILSGKLTSIQKLLAMRRHRARRNVVNGLLTFYIANNVLYQRYGVQLNEEAMSKICEGSDVPGVVIEEASNIELDLPKTHDENISDGSFSHGDDETLYVESVHAAINVSGNTTVDILDAARETLVVRNEGRVLSDWDKDMFGLAFPDLFPRGRGHPGTERSVPVSLEECIRYYLRLSTRQFAKHQTFPLVSFDICGKRRVATSTTIRSKRCPTEFEKISHVSKNDLAIALFRQREHRVAVKAGIMGAKLSSHNLRSDGERLLNNVRISQKHMWGSAEERLSYRRKGFCMDAYMKSGAIFVTITPTEIGTIVVAVLAGDVTLREAEELRDGTTPSRAARVEIARRDPVACAEYFVGICERFFDDIVGFSSSRGLPYRCTGVFGPVKAYFGTVETQSSGTLHLHSIIYISGLPGTAAEFSKRCNDVVKGESFKNRFQAVVDSVIRTGGPVRDVETPCGLCPNCSSPLLKMVETFPREAYMQRSSRHKPVATSKCARCLRCYGATEVIRYNLEKMHQEAKYRGCMELIPLGENAKESDSLTEEAVCHPSIPDWPCAEDTTSELGHGVRLTQLILLTQQHNSCHVPSCFKTSKQSSNSECRYQLPKKGGKQTSIGVGDVLHVGRRNHNEYINSFNDVILSLLRCNHDIRYLVSGGTTDALYYCMKYVTKGPRQIECVDELVLSQYEKRRKREQESSQSGLSRDGRSLGRSMVNSIAIALSKTQQMASTLCSLYLMRRTSMFSSHEFVPVHLGQSMSIAQHEEYEAALVATGNDKMVATTQLNDYMCRPEALHAISMVEFVVSYERKRGVAPIENEEDEFFSFNSRHPLCTTHFLRKRNSTVIPDIIGPRIPDRRKLKSQDEKERYALIAMLLIRPFFDLKCLKTCSMGYWDAFEEFETSSEMTESRKKYLRNHQEYYVSKENAALERKVLGGVFQEFVAEGDIWDDHGEEELQPADGIESTDSIKPHDACEGVSVNAVASEELGHMHSGTLDLVRFLKHTTCIDITAYANSAQRDTDRSGGQKKLWSGTTDYVFALSTTENAHATELAAFQRKTVEEATIRTEITGDTRPRNDTSILDVPNTQIRDSISFETSSRERAVTTVEKMQLGTAQTGASTVEKSISEAACIERRGSTTEYYPSIEDVMQRFSLNKLQGVAFREVGAALVQRLQCDNCSDMKKPADGFAMYLGGEGGTGKSRVIEALVYLSKAWRKETSVRVCAPTGIAASLVGGQTFHSLVNIRPGKEYKKTEG